MPTLDRFLQSVASNNMDALILEPGRLPRLRKGDVEREVTKTVLTAQTIDRLVAELAPAVPASGNQWEFDYQLEQDFFHFSGAMGPGGWVFTATPAGAAAALLPGVPIEAAPPLGTPAPLEAAPLPGTPLAAAPLPGVPLEAAPLPGAPLEAAPLPGVPLEPAPLPGAPLEPAPLPGVPLEAAPLPGAPLEPVPLPGAPLEPAPLPGAPLEPVPLPGAPLAAAPLPEAEPIGLGPAPIEALPPEPMPLEPVEAPQAISLDAAAPIALGTAEPEPAPAPAAAPVAAAPVAAAAPTGGNPLPSIDALLHDMISRGASDLHLSSGQPCRLRLHGDLVHLDYDIPSPEYVRELLYAIAPEKKQKEYEACHDSDFAYEIKGLARFRVNFFKDRNGLGTVMRQIPEKVPSADDLGLPQSIRNLAYLSKGLVLVTGPTGSGKSTTLAALVDVINELRNEHIITIEDPVEFVHPSKKCMVNQRQVEDDTESFYKALRAALREDPDVVLVGEMRDLETTAIAIETAETGHLVFGTLHTTSAISTIERLINQFPADRQEQVRLMLAESLKAVVAQALLKRIGGGRVAAQEILICSRAVSNLIRENKSFQIASIMQTAKTEGNILLNDALTILVKEGTVEAMEAYIKATDKDDLTNRFKKANIDTKFIEEIKDEL